jgi:hypothetical protein
VAVAGSRAHLQDARGRRFRPNRPGARRARSHCRFVLLLLHVIKDLLTYSVPPFLKRQCDRTLGARQEVPGGVQHAGPLLRYLPRPVRGDRRIWSHCRFKSSGIEYVSESGIAGMSGGATRQCDRALGDRRRGRVCRRAARRVRLHLHQLSGEKDAKLAQKSGQLQPFIAIFG